MPDAESQLSLFESREVGTNALALSGTIGDPLLQPLDEFKVRQRVVLLVVCDTESVAFKEGKHGLLVRKQSLTATEAYQVGHLIDESAVLAQVRREQEEAVEARMALIARDFGEGGDDEPGAPSDFEARLLDKQTGQLMDALGQGG